MKKKIEFTKEEKAALKALSKLLDDDDYERILIMAKEALAQRIPFTPTGLFFHYKKETPLPGFTLRDPKLPKRKPSKHLKK